MSKKLIYSNGDKNEWELDKSPIQNKSLLAKKILPIKVVAMLKDGRIFRVISDKPIELEILEFDDEINSDEYAEYVDYLEMTMPNQIKID